MVTVLAGEGGISVDPGRMQAAAASLQSLSQDVAGASADLVAALAGAENGVGDPSTTAAISDLIEAWIGPLGLLGPLLDKVASTVSASAEVYSTTDSAVAAHIR